MHLMHIMMLIVGLTGRLELKLRLLYMHIIRQSLILHIPDKIMKNVLDKAIDIFFINFCLEIPHGVVDLSFIFNAKCVRKFLA